MARIGIGASAALACALLWYPSALIGVALFELMGQYTFLTIRGLWTSAAISLGLLLVPAAILFWVGRTFPLRRALALVSATVVVWHVAWIVVLMATGAERFVAWPWLEGTGASPQPWNGPFIFSVGLGIVAAVAAVAALLINRPTMRGAAAAEPRA